MDKQFGPYLLGLHRFRVQHINGPSGQRSDKTKSPKQHSLAKGF
jgi:hypothetical protein